MALAVLRKKPYRDFGTDRLATSIVSRYFHWDNCPSIPPAFYGKYLQGLEPGMVGPQVGGVANTVRRSKYMGHPDVLPGVVNLLSLGAERMCLYGTLRWIEWDEASPRVREELDRLKKEAERLSGKDDSLSRDLARRYAVAVEILQRAIEQARARKRT
jgi:hypothetical protein